MMVAIIQARINSSRLPAKVLLDLAGKPMLTRVIERVQRAKRVQKVIVATSSADRDDPIALLCARLGTECFRGSEVDVLNRYYRAALGAQASSVVRITSDCPVVDPEVIDESIARFEQGETDYVTNCGFPGGYPRGFDVEVLSFNALQRAWTEDHNAATREHVTAYITDHPELFAIAELRCPEDLQALRLTVDTIEDYHLLFKIYRELGDVAFGWRDVAALLDRHREWLRINAHVRQTRLPSPQHT